MIELGCMDRRSRTRALTDPKGRHVRRVTGVTFFFK